MSCQKVLSQELARWVQQLIQSGFPETRLGRLEPEPEELRLRLLGHGPVVHWVLLVAQLEECVPGTWPLSAEH